MDKNSFFWKMVDGTLPTPPCAKTLGLGFVEIDGERFPGAVRDTILVTPGRRVVVAFDANNPGWWALHCHLLYHLDAGMFTTIRYV